jgi:hypothetical protein
MTGGNKMKEREFMTVENMAEKPDNTDFVLVEGDIFPEDEKPNEVVDDLPEIINEDLLYEEYRDEGFEREKR